MVFISTGTKLEQIFLIRPRPLICGSFAIHYALSAHHPPLQAYSLVHLWRRYINHEYSHTHTQKSTPMRSFCEYALGRSSGRQNYSCVVHNSNVSAVGLATGPTWRLPPTLPPLIPVLIGHVSRQSTERSITDVSSRCGEGSEPR